jgi:hypothetical protein
MGKLPTSPPALDSALRDLLRPLIRLLLARGMTYTELTPLLKELYFEVASWELAPGAAPQTDSRISLISGLHRKDVRRFRAEGVAGRALARETSLASEVFTRWISDKRFLNTRRQPLPLARLASAGGRRSFEHLALSVSKDVRSRALLEELLRLGMVTIDAKDRVVLNQRAFVPPPGSQERLYFFSRNAHDHLAAAVANLLGRDPTFLEQAIFADDLSEESVAELEAAVKSEWQALVRSIVPRASRLDERDAAKRDNGHRMRFGIYFYSEKKSADAPGANPAGRKNTRKAPTPNAGPTRRKRTD